VSEPTSPADLVILGGGSGGYAAAFRARELGMSVVLIEKDKVGGTCLHRGCIPTKALLHSGEIADLAREGEQFGVKTSLAGIDMDGVNSYKDGVVSKLSKGLQGLVKARKITYVEGEGRLTSPTTVEVNGQTYEGKHILLATGSYARSCRLEEDSSSRGTRCGRASTMVTSTPKDFQAVANSLPMTPPPRMITELGTRSSWSA
jgi:dihydrolipoamide dehydrogenase